MRDVPISSDQSNPPDSPQDGPESPFGVRVLAAEVRAARAEISRLTACVNHLLERPRPERRRLLSVEEAATQINVSERTLRSLISGGEILSVKVGRRRLLPVDSVDAFVRRLVNGGNG